MVSTPAAASTPQSMPERRHGARHRRDDRLGVDAGQRARHQQLDPAEHEAEERRHADAGLDQRDEDA